MKRSEKRCRNTTKYRTIRSLGYVWNSRQNGMVLDVRGISHCINVGHHGGVEPKIMIVYETE